MKDVRQSAMSIEVTDPKQAARNYLSLENAGGIGEEYAGTRLFSSFLGRPLSDFRIGTDATERIKLSGRSFFSEAKKKGCKSGKGESLQCC